MPLDARVLGFSNGWYGEAVRSSNAISLVKSLTIRIVTPVLLTAKLEAFRSRGEDYFGRHDLEDALSVIDGRAGLLLASYLTGANLVRRSSRWWGRKGPVRRSMVPFRLLLFRGPALSAWRQSPLQLLPGRLLRRHAIKADG